MLASKIYQCKMIDNDNVQRKSDLKTLDNNRMRLRLACLKRIVCGDISLHQSPCKDMKNFLFHYFLPHISRRQLMSNGLISDCHADKYGSMNKIHVRISSAIACRV